VIRFKVAYQQLLCATMVVRSAVTGPDSIHVLVCQHIMYHAADKHDTIQSIELKLGLPVLF